ncbi:MAG: glycosyltransferase [Oscillospiraceae bacterium]|nr:glycosyltransferase [Oscillospiraceae bacterium]
MVLTIGMIVKNEGRILERCLESLKPIREALETELIIVDTGSEDNTVEIAEKYADEVRRFEWVKDFSAARNASLEGAKGEWFMYIDADEWFGDCTELIEFFKSGEYKRYNSACYTQRNYSEADLEGRYFDAVVLRMTKIMPNTKFVKLVHEYLNTRGEPIKILGSYVHHTGYAGLGGADNPKRLSYIEILLRELEETGGAEVITYMQLFDLYFAYDNAKAEEYCKKGIEVNTRLRYNTFLNYVFMKGVALARANGGNYAKAAQTISDYFAKRAKDRNVKGMIANDIEMYALKAIASHKLGNIQQMKSAAKRYNDLYLKYKKGMYRTADLMSSAPRFLNDEEFIQINRDLVNALEKSGALSEAEEFRKNLPLDASVGENNDGGEKIVLTIGMIVKNEEKTLERCLESLAPIRKAVKTELIIVDTGSSDGTVEIAEKYADEVRHFEWVSDFAAARNASLKGAKGEWFMFIDADEWFGDSSDLTEFFISGEYKRFNSAAYTLRNYMTEDINSRYVDGLGIRVTKILPDTAFVKPIHEYLNTCGEPYKTLTSYVHHIGYAETSNQKEEKRQRNINILLRELEETKGDSVSAYNQLFDVYYGVDNALAEEYCKKGIEANTRLNYSIYMNYVFLKGIALSRINAGDCSGADDVIRDYFAKRAKDKHIKGIIANDIEMHALKAVVSQGLLNISQMKNSVKRYNDLYKKYKQGMYRTPDLLSYAPRFLSDNEFINLNLDLIDVLEASGAFGEAEEFRKNLPREASPAANENADGQTMLTIGMIVKNEEENLERCLESLAPIRESVKTELIIVDTGSTDNTVAIAQKYADEVRHFEWIKDFAAARNVSLKDAKGKWFMFIDADEWFGDCEEIIAFFNTGEYKNYNTASYLVRNYMTDNIHGRYSAGAVLRITKILPQTRFEGVIHEHLTTTGEPIKQLNSYSHHFGYLELNDDDSEKRKRNTELLLKKLAEDADNALNYQQLFDVNYGFDNQKAIEYAQKGIKVAEKKNENPYLPYILTKSIISAYIYDEAYENAAEALKGYFIRKVADKSVEPVIVTDMDIYAMKTVTYLKLDVNEAVRAFNKYTEIYKKYKKGTLKTNDIYYDIPRYSNEVEQLNISCMLLGALIKGGKYHTALEYRKNAPYSQIILSFGYGTLRVRIKGDLEIIIALEKYAVLDDLLNQLKEDKTAVTILEELLLEKLASMTVPDAKAKFINELNARAVHSELSVQFKRSLILHNRKDGVTEDYVYSVIGEHAVLPAYLADIVYLSLKHNVLEHEVLSKTDTERLEEYYNACNHKEAFLQTLREYAERDDGEQLTPFQYMWKARAALLALKRIQSLSDADTVGLFTIYSFYSMSYNEAVFKNEITAGELAEELPKENLIGHYSFRAAVAFNNRDVKTCVGFMKKAAVLDIGLKRVVTAMGKLF